MVLGHGCRWPHLADLDETRVTSSPHCHSHAQRESIKEGAWINQNRMGTTAVGLGGIWVGWRGVVVFCWDGWGWGGERI